MDEITPTFSVHLGSKSGFQWQISRAVLCVYLLPGGGLHRAIWQLEAASGAKLGCVFAEVRNGVLTQPAEGNALADALRALPGFDEVTFEAALQAVAEGTAGRFVCWQRAEPTE